MNSCIKESTSGGESLFQGGGFLRTLCVIILVTWFPFPIWYLLSPEGFNIVQNVPLMKVTVAFLNIVAKASFMICLARFRSDHLARQKTLVAVGYFADSMDGIVSSSMQDAEQNGQLNKHTRMHVREVLDGMGRSKDYERVVSLLESHLITTTDATVLPRDRLAMALRTGLPVEDSLIPGSVG